MAFWTASIARWLWVGGFPSQSAPWAAPGTRGITLNPHSSGRGARIKPGRPVTADTGESLPTWVSCDDMARVSWATRVLTVASGAPAALTMQGEDYQPPPLVVAGREDLVNFLDCERVASSPGRIDFFRRFHRPHWIETEDPVDSSGTTDHAGALEHVASGRGGQFGGCLPELFMPERVDGVESGGAAGWHETEEDADGGGEDE